MTPRRWLHSLLWALPALLCAGLLLRGTLAPIHLRTLALIALGCAANALLVWVSREALWKKGWWNLLLFTWLLTLLLFTNAMGIGKVQLPRAAFALLLLIPLWRALLLGVVRRNAPNWRKGLSLLGVSLLTLFLLAEAACMFVAYPVGPARSLSSQLWYARHWKPINSMGFRDVEYESGKGGKPVLVVGDSYAAGQGIEEAQDRFPDLLRGSLPQGMQLVNLSQPGATTRTEWEFYTHFPDSASMVVLSYLTNDIEEAAAAAGHVFAPRDMQSYPEVLRFFVHNSYCINLLYSVTPYTTDFGYSEYLEKMAADHHTWDNHFAELKQFTDDAHRRNIPLLVLLWPDLVDPHRTEAHLARVSEFLVAQGAEVTDLTPVALSMPVEDRVVNGNDAHPGEAMHKAAAGSVQQSPQWPKAR